MTDTCCRDLMFLHCLKQRSLGFRRSAVDFICQDQIRKNRAAHKSKAPAVGRFREDFRAGDVGGHQVRRELNPLELEVENAGDGFHQQGLRQARGTGQQAMPTGQQREQELLHHVALPDKDLAEFRGEAITSSVEAILHGFIGDEHGRWQGSGFE